MQFALISDRACIDVVRDCPQDLLSRKPMDCKGPGEWRDVMERTAMRGEFAVRLLVSVVILLTGVAVAQDSTKEQCSMAVVSRLVGSGQKVCDTTVVQDMAKRGHAFEQNQLGLASVLAIGPDFNEKEALKWFEQA